MAALEKLSPVARYSTLRTVESTDGTTHWCHMHADLADNPGRACFKPNLVNEIIQYQWALADRMRRTRHHDSSTLQHVVLASDCDAFNLGGDLEYFCDSFDFGTDAQIAQMKEYALKINEILKAFLLERKIELVDFKLEFGVDAEGKVILADEITPDTARLWDADTKEKLDKDRFRRDMGNVEEAYQEVIRRLIGK